MKIAVVVFPGSNADYEALTAARHVLSADARYVFHKEHDLGDADAVIVPGGFAHGDYLRCGAIARFSPIADALYAFAERGGPILGICNGFQVLTEMHLLPGALTRNAHLRFECKDVWVKVEAQGAWTTQERGVLRLPIAHGEGRYECDPETLQRLRGEGRIALRYCGPDGAPGGNPNGSVDDIAGVYNERRNVLGLMPHPERAADAMLGNEDGRALFLALGRHLAA
jgi:phosphoribosylformylglycinamidine synthase subunit PurQ / glutaminase